MESQFTAQEKRKWLFKKHLKDHAFEYVLDIVLTMVFAYLLLKLCKAENIVLGIFLAFAWSLGRSIRQIHWYKKDYLDMIVKE